MEKDSKEVFTDSSLQRKARHKKLKKIKISVGSVVVLQQNTTEEVYVPDITNPKARIIDGFYWGKKVKRTKYKKKKYLITGHGENGYYGVPCREKVNGEEDIIVRITSDASVIGVNKLSRPVLIGDRKQIGVFIKKAGGKEVRKLSKRLALRNESKKKKV